MHRKLMLVAIGFGLSALQACSIAGMLDGGSAMAPDQFQWGETSCEGLAVGLAVRENEPNEPLRYQLALANRTASPRRVALFATLPGLYRLRVVGRQGTVETVRPAFGSKIRVTANYAIRETLAPRQVFQRRGDPADFAGRLSGKGTLQLVFSLPKPNRSVFPDVGEESDVWCHVWSGEVPVEFYSIEKD